MEEQDDRDLPLMPDSAPDRATPAPSGTGSVPNWAYAPPAWTTSTTEILPPLPGHTWKEIALSSTLFLLTTASTLWTMANNYAPPHPLLRLDRIPATAWRMGALYSMAIMVILVSHEMGHYVACRRYRVRSTLPLLIPMPHISPFGTMGAVIFMRALGRDRRSLFDIGIAGPLAGLVPALLAAAWGLSHSSVITTLPGTLAGVRLGDSLLFRGMQSLSFPALLPNQDILLHPVAYAGWAGLFLTALNLLPVGQLDGGHVVYGLLGRKSVMVSWIVIAGLAVLAWFNPEWWFLLAVLILLIGPRHRPALNEVEPLSTGRVVLGLCTIAFFFLIFTPKPFQLP